MKDAILQKYSYFYRLFSTIRDIINEIKNTNILFFMNFYDVVVLKFMFVLSTGLKYNANEINFLNAQSKNKRVQFFIFHLTLYSIFILSLRSLFLIYLLYIFAYKHFKNHDKNI